MEKIRYLYKVLKIILESKIYILYLDTPTHPLHHLTSTKKIPTKISIPPQISIPPKINITLTTTEHRGRHLRHTSLPYNNSYAALSRRRSEFGRIAEECS